MKILKKLTRFKYLLKFWRKFVIFDKVLRKFWQSKIHKKFMINQV